MLEFCMDVREDVSNGWDMTISDGKGNLSVMEDASEDPFHETMEVGAVRYSSDLGISAKTDIDVGSSSHSNVEHCQTTIVRSSSTNQLLDGSKMTSLRGKTKKRGTSRHDMKFDRLSDHDKKIIIENLVKINRDGSMEVDVSHAPIASELLELDDADASPVSINNSSFECNEAIPKLKVAMLVVGTRGDVQPFLAIAKRLQEFGHHVRLATHINFRNFVKSADVEFYPLGGDPRILASYMAKTRGFLLSGPSEINMQRKQVRAIMESLLPACTEPDLDSGTSFRAQVIIANPPAYGHVHVAEALGVPLHIFFTMPWTPTHEFSHPLVRVPQSVGYKFSYIAFDLIIWWGIRGFINNFRRRKLGLPSIAYFSTYHGSISHLPTGYMWSPHLVPKPNDWGSLVDVVGYCFLNLGTKYQPPKEFQDWLQKGPKPIYIGFGSMPLEDAKKTTAVILEALKQTGQKGVIGRGWGDLGTLFEVPEDVFLLDDCPHDWLFPQCSAVIHHGGAGTTATGLIAGCPTTVVPFFGDQYFWGDRIYERGVGPAPIPISQLTTERLSNAIEYMLDPEVKLRVMELAKQIGNEDGIAAAVNSFHHHLPPEMPLPHVTFSEDDECPNPLRSMFLTMGKWCCLPWLSSCT